MILVAPPADFDPPPVVQAKRRLTQRVPQLYPLAAMVLRTRRHLAWWRNAARWAATRQSAPLGARVLAHSSLLLRELSPEEMVLQHNKAVNLRLASAQVDSLLIRPGETFSFNRVVGNCTRAKGYVDGMRLSNGHAFSGVGGGICQLANLIHWLVLHSPLTVAERSEHSFDPFPDKGRVLPWGVGCTIVYNYVDLVVRNDTERTFQFLTSVGDTYLEGELRSDEPLPHSYKVFGRNESFIRRGDDIFRRNEIWRSVTDQRTGERLREELVKRNCARVVYPLPEETLVIDADQYVRGTRSAIRQVTS